MINKVRTRFAPSPTGFMHIGNLRSALYAYLFARSQKGTFIIRIEDTDQKRFVEGATDVIFNTLKTANMHHDEGPDVGGDYGPYIQSERKEIYGEYAKKLVELGHGYYCFCTSKDQHDAVDAEQADQTGYNRKCRNLDPKQAQAKVDAGESFVVRQKMPLEGETSYDDLVFGKIVIKNEVLEDHVLLKSDGLPTYNFANVIDDHLMKITHVIRGTEYLPSTPKYKLLYEAFGWDVPNFAHLPLIMGKDEHGNVSKLSKRFGSTSFAELIEEGYLPEAIINYIALLGWSPKDEQEIFSLQQLEELFKLSDVSKSPSIFDYKKLAWINSEYIKALPLNELSEMLLPLCPQLPKSMDGKWGFIVEFVQDRLEKLSDFKHIMHDFINLPEYESDLLLNEKNKVFAGDVKIVLNKVSEKLRELTDWSFDSVHNVLHEVKDQNEYKMGYVMWPTRMAMSGQKFSPSASHYIYLLGLEETLNRFNVATNKL